MNIFWRSKQFNRYFLCDQGDQLNSKSTTEGDHMMSWCHGPQLREIPRAWTRKHSITSKCNPWWALFLLVFSTNLASTFDIKNDDIGCTSCSLLLLCSRPFFLFLLSAAVVNCFFRKSYSLYFQLLREWNIKANSAKLFGCSVQYIHGSFPPLLKIFSLRLSSSL